MVGDNYILPDEAITIGCESSARSTTAPRQLLLQAGLRAGHQLVEFGCGMGYVSRWAAAQEYSPRVLTLIPNRWRRPQALATAENLAMSISRRKYLRTRF